MNKLGSDGLSLASMIIYPHIKKCNVCSVGGLEIGAIPLAVSLSSMSVMLEDNLSLEWFYVRKSIKRHGLNNKIEGNPKQPVMVIDDVITSGDSVLKAINTVKEAGIEYIGTSCILFRGNSEQQKRLEKEGIFDYIFSKNDF